jgi:hypothetical protein
MPICRAWGPRRCTDVREDQARPDLRRDLAQVAVVPHRIDALEQGRSVPLTVPSDPKPIAVRRVRTEMRVQALVDQGMFRFVEQVAEQDRRSRISEPAAHGGPSLMFCGNHGEGPRAR